MEFVRAGDLKVMNLLQWCNGKWTWKSGMRKSIIDYMLFGKPKR